MQSLCEKVRFEGLFTLGLRYFCVRGEKESIRDSDNTARKANLA
jgi:hypothetical protein